MAAASHHSGDMEIIVRVPAHAAEIHEAVGAAVKNASIPWHSTTKPLVAAAMLYHVDQEPTLGLDDLVTDHIPGWTGTGVEATATLRHALAFTSGIAAGQRPWVVASDQADYQARVAALPDGVSNGRSGGQRHTYDTDNEDISGEMVRGAIGATSFADLFAQWVNTTGYFPSMVLDGPIYSAARKGTGPASEYADFLEDVLAGAVAGMSSALYDEFTSDQTAGTDQALAGEAFDVASDIGEDWRMSFGWWLECRHSRFVCSGGAPYPRMSTFGLGGQYCSVDFAKGYIVVIGPTYPGVGESEADTIYWWRDHIEGLVELWIAQGCPS
ncbi:MAG: beta-lactamase family protein [Deltaproteobacteria bacterium]|nr:beta-lactamase family protein [Deltaproteobacteria bacterium]